MLRLGFLFLIALGAGLQGTAALGDTLLIDSVDSAQATARPASGITMEQVVERFGEPQQRLGPVGEPPISHWVYGDFIVYFEYDRVIHSVVPGR